jgi:hypothetical protein
LASVMDDARTTSLAHNQSAVRSLNEQLDGGLLVPPAPLRHDAPAFLCECSNVDCSDLIYVPAATYQEVRRDPRRFFIRPGHDIPDIERVVADHGDFCVVEKTGLAAAQVTRDAG